MPERSARMLYRELNLNPYSVGPPCRAKCTVCGFAQRERLTKVLKHQVNLSCLVLIQISFTLHSDSFQTAFHQTNLIQNNFLFLNAFQYSILLIRLKLIDKTIAQTGINPYFPLQSLRLWLHFPPSPANLISTRRAIWPSDIFAVAQPQKADFSCSFSGMLSDGLKHVSPNKKKESRCASKPPSSRCCCRR